MTTPDGCPLNQRQLDLLEHIANGQTPSQIAHATHRTESSIRSATQTIRDKLQTPSTMQSILRCWREGWIRVHGVAPAWMLEPAPPQHAGRIVIKPAYRIYLYAFDLYVAAKTDDEKRAARHIMDQAAGEAGIPTGRPDTQPDLVDLLIEYVRRERQARRTLAKQEAA